MKFTRLFTGTDQKSHFEDLEMLLSKIEIGKISDAIAVEKIMFGEIEDVQEISWHNPPCRQYVIMLEGGMEIETGHGIRRIFNSGDILLAEDTTGQGHITRAVGNGKRKYMVISLK